MCTKFDVTVEAILHSDYLTLMFPSLIGKTDNSAVVEKAIRSVLLKPRREFTITFNGVDLIPEATAAFGIHPVDAQNGPRPQWCNLTQLTNTSYMLSYRIIAHYWENNVVNVNANQDLIVRNRIGNNVLYNRWTETVDYDNKNYARRTREGKFGIRSDNSDGKIADQIRSQMAVVSVPAGFVRESASYTVTPDGLAIQYRIIDKEVFKPPPEPAFEADGHYIETATEMGAIRTGECRVSLKGDKTTSQVFLAQQAVRIAAGKLFIRGIQLNQAGIFRKRVFTILGSASLRIGLWDNTAECVLRMIGQADQRRFDAIAAFQDFDNFTPVSDDNPARIPPYLDRGTSNLLIQAAAYYDPSLRATSLGQGVIASADNPPTKTGALAVQLTTGTQVGRAGKEGE